ncbi:hypothetical protein PIB30_084572 [Stylosanthes scabra]|uniref:Uncharacterized protein n=1 Tax=Stylosanthes scabra TaxID=79078 RepID=A0ABU6YRD9_9FABA|nr:hypothetical protein [Stylosanthes scabra]
MNSLLPMPSLAFPMSFSILKAAFGVGTKTGRLRLRKEDKREATISLPRERGAMLAIVTRKNEAGSARRNNDNDARKNGLALATA